MKRTILTLSILFTCLILFAQNAGNDEATLLNVDGTQMTRGREFVVKMREGADPVLAITEFAKQNNIRFGRIHTAFKGNLQPLVYEMWIPNPEEPTRLRTYPGTISDKVMVCAIGGMIVERPLLDGTVEPFAIMHFAAGGAYNVPAVCGHLEEGSRVKGALMVFITELVDVEVEFSPTLVDPETGKVLRYARHPENIFKYTGNDD